MTTFNPLNVPDHWNQYYTKYPQGYTILEALMNWVQQVNDMVGNVNDWNVYLDDFKNTFDTELQTTVSDLLTDWQESGLLGQIIGQALQTEIDTVNSQVNANTALLGAHDTQIKSNITAIANIGNATPKATFNTVTDLQNTYPAGTTGIFVVAADGKWYYWNGAQWTAGGTYQATGLGTKTVTRGILADNYAENTALTTNTDLNTIQIEGNFWKDGATTLVNAPAGMNGKAGLLNVKRFGATYFQTFYDYLNPNLFYLRTISGSTQRAWFTFDSLAADVYSGITAGSALSAITQNGKYLGLSTDTYTDRPTGLSGVSFMLNVQCYGSDKSFIIQQAIQTNDTSKMYLRYIRSGVPTAWITYDSKGIDAHASLVSGTPLINTTIPGKYLGLSTDIFSDRPDGLAGVAFMLNVQGYGADQSFILQTATQTNTPENSYTRYLRNGVATPWLKNYSFSPTAKPLIGKTIVCFGDSITEGGAYPATISNITGATTYNIGFGGCRMATVPSDNFRYPYNEMSMVRLAQTIASQDFTALDACAQNLIDTQSDDNTPAVNRLKSIDFTKVDAITIFYGTNDYTSLVPVGNPTSTNEMDFNGAINLTVQRIAQAYPHIQIIFISPLWRARLNTAGDGLESDSTANDIGVLLPTYVQNLLDRAKDNKVPSLDFYHTSGINKYNAGAMLSDGLHPNTDGDNHVASRLSAYLNSIIA